MWNDVFKVSLTHQLGWVFGKPYIDTVQGSIQVYGDYDPGVAPALQAALDVFGQTTVGYMLMRRWVYNKTSVIHSNKRPQDWMRAMTGWSNAVAVYTPRFTDTTPAWNAVALLHELCHFKDMSGFTCTHDPWMHAEVFEVTTPMIRSMINEKPEIFLEEHFDWSDGAARAYREGAVIAESQGRLDPCKKVK